MNRTIDPHVAERIQRTRRQYGPIGPGDPRHGQNSGYIAGCRDECCRRAHSLQRNLNRLYPSSLVDATGTHRRVEALACLGWSRPEIAARLNRSRTWLRKVLESERVQRATAAMIAAVYDELSMTHSTSPMASRTAAQARARGAAPPLAWEDGEIDDPSARPRRPRSAQIRHQVDDAVVDRILAGEFKLPATPAEKGEVARRWHRGGHSLEELVRRTGWKVDRYYKASEAA